MFTDKHVIPSLNTRGVFFSSSLCRNGWKKQAVWLTVSKGCFFSPLALCRTCIRSLNKCTIAYLHYLPVCSTLPLDLSATNAFDQMEVKWNQRLRPHYKLSQFSLKLNLSLLTEYRYNCKWPISVVHFTAYPLKRSTLGQLFHYNTVSEGSFQFYLDQFPKYHHPSSEYTSSHCTCYLSLLFCCVTSIAIGK